METQNTNNGTEKVEAKIPTAVVESLNKVSIDKDIDKFFREIDGLANTLPLTMLLLNIQLKRSREALDAKYSPIEIKGDNNTVYLKYSNVTRETITHFNKLEKRLGKASLAMRMVPQSYLVSLISQYDAFIGDFIKSFYYLKPELLNASGRQLSFAELRKIGSIEAASEYVVEKEVDVVMRGSHIEQIDWLAKFSGVELRKELKAWKGFVEITLRRNLFVHTGGRVPQQYLDGCKDHGISVAEVNKCTQLHVSAKYFVTAYETILEVGLIIAQAIWRKLLPEQREDADSNLNNICVELISENRYRLACRILDHAIEEFKHHTSSEQYQMMMVVNQAQSYKWYGDNNKACKILTKHDWSAKSIEYKLAVAVLLDKFDEVYRLMSIIGATGTPSQHQYRDWPLFKEIRKQQEFINKYEEIFSQPFGEVEAKPSPEDVLFDFGRMPQFFDDLEKVQDD